MPSPGSTCR